MEKDNTDLDEKKTITLDSDESEDELESNSIPKDLYEKTRDDMLKYKKKRKELETQLMTMQEQLKTKEREELYEKERFKELYEKEAEEKERLKQEAEESKRKFLDFHKINAVNSLTGGFRKSEYNKFIMTDSIEMDDEGNVVSESVKREVDRIKQNYPELLKSTGSSNLPNHQAPSDNVFNKDLKSMSQAELAAYQKKLIKEKYNKPN